MHQKAHRNPAVCLYACMHVYACVVVHYCSSVRLLTCIDCGSLSSGSQASGDSSEVTEAAETQWADGTHATTHVVACCTNANPTAEPIGKSAGFDGDCHVAVAALDALLIGQYEAGGVAGAAPTCTTGGACPTTSIVASTTRTPTVALFAVATEPKAARCRRCSTSLGSTTDLAPPSSTTCPRPAPTSHATTATP